MLKHKVVFVHRHILKFKAIENTSFVFILNENKISLSCVHSKGCFNILMHRGRNSLHHQANAMQVTWAV